MLGLDEQKQLNWRREQSREQMIAHRQKVLAQELESNSITVEPDAGFDVTNLLAQMGKPMTAQQVMDKLKKCNSRLFFLPSKSYNLIGIYLMCPDGKVHVLPNGDVVTIKHICGMEEGVMPEFTVIHKKKKLMPNQDLFGHKKPTREVDWVEVDTYADQTRGWRTVLVRLLHAGLINQADVQRHFGWLPSRDSARWNQQTQ